MGKKGKPVPALAPVQKEAEFNITDSLKLQVQMPDGKQAQVGSEGIMGGVAPSKPPDAGPAKPGMPENLIGAERYRFEDLKMGEVIGEGSQAKVRKVKHSPTKKLLALKIITFSPDMTRKVLQTELNRCSGADNHPNLVTSLEAFFKEGYLMVLMEYMHYGALSGIAHKALRLNKEFPELVLSRMAKDMLLGLNHLHTVTGIIHRDLKPSNMLVNADGVLKISDFGVATFLSNQNKMAFTAVGSTAYMSPERVRGDGYTTASDIWAVGVSVAELALGFFPIGAGKDSNTPLFELCSIIAEERATVMWRDVTRSGAPPSPELKDFVAKCMLQKSDDRPSAIQLLGHAFIKKHEKSDVDLGLWCKQAVGKA